MTTDKSSLDVEIRKLRESHGELLELLRSMTDGKVQQNCVNAVHPSKKFCAYCGLNSATEIHNRVCTVGLAELAIAKAGAL